MIGTPIAPTPIMPSLLAYILLVLLGGPSLASILGREAPDKSNMEIRLQSKWRRVNQICAKLLERENIDCIVSDRLLVIVIYGADPYHEESVLIEFTSGAQRDVIDAVERYTKSLRKPAFVIPAVNIQSGIRHEVGRKSSDGVFEAWDFYFTSISTK